MGNTTVETTEIEAKAAKDKDLIKDSESKPNKFVTWTARSFFVSSLSATLWAGSIVFVIRELYSHFPPEEIIPNDLSSLLFGASSIALFAFSVILGLTAFIGYDRLKKDTANEVKTALREEMDKRMEEADKRMEAVEKELRGRVGASIGLMFGIFHATPEEQTEEERLDYLAEGVTQSEQAYLILKDVKSKAKYMALNNFIYYSCELGMERIGYRKDYLLRMADELRAFSQENFPDTFVDGLLTYCKAVLTLSDDATQIDKALKLASGLTEIKNDRQRNEATNYVAPLKRKLDQKRISN
jgi:hypothetical protein